MTRSSDLFELSTEVTTAWTFRTQHADGAFEILPLPSVRFSPALDEHNQTRARVLVLAVHVERARVVVVKPCGFSLDRALAEREIIERSVVAMTGARVYVTDGNAFFNRPGPRLVESLEIMAACVHPALFDDFARAHAGVIVRVG